MKKLLFASLIVLLSAQLAGAQGKEFRGDVVIEFGDLEIATSGKKIIADTIEGKTDPDSGEIYGVTFTDGKSDSTSDDPYDEGTWNGDQDAATKNAIRDKIETLAGGHDPVTLGTQNGLSLSAQELSLSAATNSAPGAATAAQITKLEGVATGATANSPDATLLNRANHTGTQATSTISDFDSSVSANSDVAANTAASHAESHTVTSHSDVTAKSGDSTVLGTTSGSFTPGNCIESDANGNHIDSGGVCGGGGGAVDSVTGSTFIDSSPTTGSVIVSLSATGTPSAATFLRGDNTWAVPAGSGDVTKVGTPVNDQVGVWTGDGTIEGDSTLTYSGTTLFTPNVRATGSVIGEDLGLLNGALESVTLAMDSGTTASYTTSFPPAAPASNGMIRTYDTDNSSQFVDSITISTIDVSGTLKVDTIEGYTAANDGTAYGVPFTDGAIDSADVNYTAAGAGAVERTVYEKLGDKQISILDFGADINGTEYSGSITATQDTVTLTSGGADWAVGDHVSIADAGKAETTCTVSSDSLVLTAVADPTIFSVGDITRLVDGVIAVAQERTMTIEVVGGIGEVFTIELMSPDMETFEYFTYTVQGGDTTTDVAAGLETASAGATLATITSSGAVVTMIATTAGTPFYYENVYPVKRGLVTYVMTQPNVPLQHFLAEITACTDTTPADSFCDSGSDITLETQVVGIKAMFVYPTNTGSGKVLQHLNNRLLTTITDINGDVLTLNDSAITTVSGVRVVKNAQPSFEAAVAQATIENKTVYAPPGEYWMMSNPASLGLCTDMDEVGILGAGVGKTIFKTVPRNCDMFRWYDATDGVDDIEVAQFTVEVDDISSRRRLDYDTTFWFGYISSKQPNENIEIHHVEVVNAGYFAIRLYNPVNVNIHHNIINNVAAGIDVEGYFTSIGNRDAIPSYGPLNVSDNTINNVSWSGINVKGLSNGNGGTTVTGYAKHKNVVISSNNISHAYLFAIEIYGNETNAAITGNNMEYAGQYSIFGDSEAHGGIVTKMSSNVSVTGNNARHCWVGIEVIGVADDEDLTEVTDERFVVQPHGITVTGNTAYGMGYKGISSFAGVKGLIIKGNVIEIGPQGIGINGSTTIGGTFQEEVFVPTITDNTITKTGLGLVLDTLVYRGIVKDNTFINNNYKEVEYVDSIVEWFGAIRLGGNDTKRSTAPVIESNIFIDNRVDATYNQNLVVIYYTDDAIIQGNQWFGETPNNIVVNLTTEDTTEQGNSWDAEGLWGLDALVIAHSELSLDDGTNPHGTTASDVGNDTAQWDADKIQGVTVDDTDKADGKILQFNSTSGNLEYESLAAGHTQNTDTGTSSDDFAIGDGTDTDKTITAANGDGNEPLLKYDSAVNKWQYSNDGTTFNDIGSGSFDPNGVSGGQSVTGGTDAGDNLDLESTSDGTKGNLTFGSSVYDEVNDRLGINETAPDSAIHVFGDQPEIRVQDDADVSAYFSFGALSQTIGVFKFVAPGGGISQMDFEPTLIGGTGSSVLRLFRNTIADAVSFQIYAGNGNNRQHYLRGDGTSYLSEKYGDLGIGALTTPTAQVMITARTNEGLAIRGDDVNEILEGYAADGTTKLFQFAEDGALSAKAEEVTKAATGDMTSLEFSGTFSNNYGQSALALISLDPLTGGENGCFETSTVGNQISIETDSEAIWLDGVDTVTDTLVNATPTMGDEICCKTGRDGSNNLYLKCKTAWGSGWAF
jgi:hypothetical protein